MCPFIFLIIFIGFPISVNVFFLRMFFYFSLIFNFMIYIYIYLKLVNSFIIFIEVVFSCNFINVYDVLSIEQSTIP